jgi:hypothetical protein
MCIDSVNDRHISSSSSSSSGGGGGGGSYCYYLIYDLVHKPKTLSLKFPAVMRMVSAGE